MAKGYSQGRRKLIRIANETVMKGLAYAYRDSGMSRRTGALIIGAYLVFLGSLWIVAHSAEPGLAGSVVPLALVVAGSGAALAGRRRRLR